MKIGIIQTRPGIGDICIFLPFIHFIANFHKTKVYLFTKKRTAAKELLQHDPHIENIIYIDQDNTASLNKNLFLEIKKNNINKIFIFHFGIKYFLLSFFAGVEQIKFYGILKRKVSITGYIKKKILDWLNIDKLNYKCKLYTKNENEKKFYLAIGIGGSGYKKKWKIENFIKLINIIHNHKPELNFIIAGGPEESKDFTKIQNSLPDIDFYNLCDKNISDSIKILNSSILYIGNDTGFMHICGSLNVPSFGIFGTTPNDYCDYNDILYPIMPKGFKTVGFEDNALDLIKPEDVFKFVKDKNFLD